MLSSIEGNHPSSPLNCMVHDVKRSYRSAAYKNLAIWALHIEARLRRALSAKSEPLLSADKEVADANSDHLMRHEFSELIR